MNIPGKYKGLVATADDPEFYEKVKKYFLSDPQKYQHKCRLTFDLFLLWVGLDSQKKKRVHVEIYNEYFNVHYWEYLRTPTLDINLNSGYLENYMDVYDRLGDRMSIISNNKLAKYMNIEKCKEKTQKLKRDYPDLFNLFLSENDFDQREILNFLYDSSIKHISIEAEFTTTVDSTLKLSRSKRKRTVILSLLFDNLTINESVLIKFIRSLKSMKRNILNEVRYQTFDLRTHILNIPDYLEIDYNITSRNITVILTFTIEVWSAKKYYTDGELGANRLRLSSLCSKDSRYSSAELLVWAHELNIDTNDLGFDRICQAIEYAINH